MEFPTANVQSCKGLSKNENERRLRDCIQAAAYKNPTISCRVARLFLFHTTLSSSPIHTMNPLKNILPYIARMSQTAANASATPAPAAQPHVSVFCAHPRLTYLLTTTDLIDSLSFRLSRIPRTRKWMTIWWVAVRSLASHHRHPRPPPLTPIPTICFRLLSPSHGISRVTTTGCVHIYDSQQRRLSWSQLLSDPSFVITHHERPIDCWTVGCREGRLGIKG